MTRVDLTVQQCRALGEYLRNRVDRGMGCGYEHDCSIHGCRIMRVAAERLEQLTGAVGRQEVMVYRDGG